MFGRFVKHLAWVSLLSLLFPDNCRSQAGQNIWEQNRTFTTENGLPINSVFSLKKAPDGLIWIGTADGLVFSDGFQIIKKPAFEVPEVLQKGSFIRDIQRIGETMYVSANDTAFKWNEQGWQGLPKQFNGRRLFTLGGNWYEARPGADKLVSYLVYAERDRLVVVDSLVYQESALVADSEKLITIHKENFYRYDLSQAGLSNRKPFVFSGTENQSFFLLARFGDFGVLLITQNTAGYLVFSRVDLTGRSQKVAEINPGEVFQNKVPSIRAHPAVVSEAGNNTFFVLFENQSSFRLRIVKSEQKFSVVFSDFQAGFIRALLPPSQTELWHARDTEGIFIYRKKSPFKRIDIGNRLVKSLSFGINGQLAAISNSPQILISYFDAEKRVMQSERILENEHGEVANMQADPDGKLLISITKLGIERHEFGSLSDKAEQYYTFLPHEKNAVIVSSDRKDTWLIMTGYLTRLDHHRKTISQTKLEVNSIVVNWNFSGFGNADSLWLNDERSLHVFDKRTFDFESFQKPNFLLQRLRTISRDDIFTDRNLIWVGSMDGIAAFDKKSKQWIEIVTEREWPSTFIYGIIPHKKDLWISTNSGIVRFTPQFEGDKIVGPVRFFTKEDGLASTEFNSYSFAQREDGLIAFGGIGGITLFHPDSIPAASTLARPILTRVELFDQFFPVESGKKVALNSDQNQFRFHYSAVDASDPAKISFEVRLFGQNQTWLKQETRRDVLFPAISPGKYAFQVRLTNEDGMVLPEKTLYEFEILPPIWLRWWFLSGTGLLLIGAIVQTVRIISTRKLRERIRQLEMERKLQEERQKTRAQIARDLHDEVSSTLSAVAMLTNRAEASADPETRGRIHEQLVEARSSMEEMIWSLSPRNDKLDRLLYRLSDLAMDFAAQASMGSDISIPSEIPDLMLSHDVRKHVYLIAKEAFINAVKYSGGTVLKLEVSISESNRLEITIADNGKGFHTPQPAKNGKGGNGLKNMKERAEAMGAEIKIDSGSGGTAVRVLLRLAEN